MKEIIYTIYNKENIYYINLASIPKEKILMIAVAIITPIIDEISAFFLSI